MGPSGGVGKCMLKFYQFYYKMTLRVHMLFVVSWSKVSQGVGNL